MADICYELPFGLCRDIRFIPCLLRLAIEDFFILEIAHYRKNIAQIIFIAGPRHSFKLQITQLPLAIYDFKFANNRDFTFRASSRCCINAFSVSGEEGYESQEFVT